VITAGFDYDVIVIGSGFGGSLSALGLTEMGVRTVMCVDYRLHALSESRRA
jgi:choline dehydrogenase-like flavoprotein